MKIPARFWLKAQQDYGEYLARQRQAEAVKNDVEWMKEFPIDDMIQKGFLPFVKSEIEKTQALLKYFGIAGSGAWEDYYQKQTLCTAFRLSLAGMKNQYSLSAWLRHGEIQVVRNKVKTSYSQEKLKNCISKMITLANSESSNFKEKLVDLCAEAGIVLVYTPHIRNSRAQGATRWVNGHPLVQISDFYKHYDIFWFSFFHEIGHILLHNKKDIFLEGIEYSEKSKKKEDEANDFSKDLLVSPQIEACLQKLDYSEYGIRILSKETGIHVAFLVGRMHYLNILPYDHGNKLIPSVCFYRFGN